jgi:hypothetical protein
MDQIRTGVSEMVGFQEPQQGEDLGDDHWVWDVSNHMERRQEG